MDIIDRAITNGYHICYNTDIKNQVWDDFFISSKNKKVFLFGIAEAVDYIFMSPLSKKIQIDYAIDNDSQKHGMELSLYCCEAYNSKYASKIINSPEIMKKYQAKDIVVLITSLRNYEKIYLQLKEMGIKNCFSLLSMEANQRLSGNYEHQSYGNGTYIDYCCGLPIDTKKIVFLFGFYGGHAKSIIRQLLKIRRDIKIVGLMNSIDNTLPSEVCQVLIKNKRDYIRELETSKVWVIDESVADYLKKRSEQVYIHVKHWSSITLKKFALDDKSTCITEKIAETIKRTGKNIDYFITGSELDEQSCRSGYAYTGPMLRFGSARSDILFEKGITERIYSLYDINIKTKTLLYSPTFRISNIRNNSNLDYFPNMDIILTMLKKKFGGNWIILVKLHPQVKTNICNIKYTKQIINVSDYPDGQELVAACDMMITDYSSIMFEPAFVRKPVFLYAPDRHEFIDKERGLLIDYDTLPFPIAETNEQLAENILSFDKETYVKNVDLFMEKYGVHEDGHASERAAKFISDLIDGKGI